MANGCFNDYDYQFKVMNDIIWSEIQNYEEKTYKKQSQKQGMFVRGRSDVCRRRAAHNQLPLPMVVDWMEQVVEQTLVLESFFIDREFVISWLNKTEVMMRGCWLSDWLAHLLFLSREAIKQNLFEYDIMDSRYNGLMGL